ncbi:MAG: metallophosphoesterase [Clostridia bacterium]|nr:metallophosphoesterase [Clostridia bacterium]
MKIYAIGDLHLSSNAEKPMDIFGGNWEGHLEKIKTDWREKVSEEDVVLIPGDISWAMKLEGALEDLRSLTDLPGKKVFIRGNHDYWWNGITRLRDSAPDSSFIFLQTDCVRLDGYVIVGSRGWACPGSPDYTEQDQKLYRREAERFRLALGCADGVKQEGDKLIALIHYPPFNLKREDSLFTSLFEEKGVDKVVFGHLHGPTFFPLFTEKNGISYHLTSCDKTDFKLTRIY